MLKVKLSIPGFKNKLNLIQFVGNLDNIYQNCKFFVNDSSVDEVDYWFVFDDLQLSMESVVVNPDNIYFLSAEVVHPRGYYGANDKAKFLDQFSKIVTCHDIYRDNAVYDIPFLVWMINSNHGPSIFEETNRDVNWLKKLNTVEKIHPLSVFCSAKIDTPDHLARYNFVKILKKHFGDVLHWYGNGIQSIPQKWDGIAPYKYHIVLENQSRHNIVTEKLFDSYLGLAYPIYWGAPNLNEYFSKKSFTKIEILDWRNAIRIIEQVLLRDEWDIALPFLVSSKNKVITDFNPFHRIAEMANKYSAVNRPKKRVELYSTYSIDRNLMNRIINRSGKLLERVGNKLVKISNFN